MHGNIAERRVDDQSPLGKLYMLGLATNFKRGITTAEYQAGVRWREVVLGYLSSIESPVPYGGDADQISDDDCEGLAEAYQIGVNILNSKGKRVLHSVAAIAVYEEPEGLGDPAFTSAAAKVGLAALAERF